jgi:hypothetical protein
MNILEITIFVLAVTALLLIVAWDDDDWGAP